MTFPPHISKILDRFSVSIKTKPGDDRFPFSSRKIVVGACLLQHSDAGGEYIELTPDDLRESAQAFKDAADWLARAMHPALYSGDHVVDRAGIGTVTLSRDVDDK